DLADLKTRLAAVESERDDLLQSLTDDDLESSLNYRTLAGDAYESRLLDLLLHVVNHSTYHRGQLTTMLRQVGAKPPSSDYVFYLREQAGASRGR
ncbi:MAG TPA: DinB family protein, partial [Thermoanaerobaculia bacterium]|nr:DinB family protein [Thermoanaerobaculia bacterium]